MKPAVQPVSLSLAELRKVQIFGQHAQNVHGPVDGLWGKDTPLL